VDNILFDDAVVSLVSRALELGKQIVLVYETRHAAGAPLNAQRRFDFDKVFNQQAPEHLKALSRDPEGIPLHLRPPRMVNAVLNTILEQVAEGLNIPMSTEIVKVEAAPVGASVYAAVVPIDVSASGEERRGPQRSAADGAVLDSPLGAAGAHSVKAVGDMERGDAGKIPTEAPDRPAEELARSGETGAADFTSPGAAGSQGAPAARGLRIESVATEDSGSGDRGGNTEPAVNAENRASGVEPNPMHVHAGSRLEEI